MMSPELSASALAHLALGGMLLAGLAAESLGRRTPLPGVTILLCMGVAVGPAGLDLLPPAREAWFPIVSSIALVMIGFLIGGEFTRERLRDIGPSIVVIAVIQAAVTFALLAGGLLLLGFDRTISLALAGIGTATAPAATVAVIREMGSPGRFSRLLIGVVAVDDVVALTAFSLAMSATAGLQAGDAPMLVTVYEIGGALILGTVVGLPMALLTGRIRSGTPTLEEAIAVVLIIAGAADALGVSQILAAMVAGCLIANLASHHERPFSEIENIEQPFLVIFFLLAGASFAFDALGQTGLIGVAYIALRTLGKIAGGWLGGMRAGLTGREAGWFGAALLPQAGVALGLALVAAERLPDSAAILNTVILATIVFELTGPIVTRVAIGRVARGDVAHTRLLPPRKQRQRWLPKRVRGDKTR
ncbi:cation:proton antiporter [Algiphilus aromaticivorans]|jgi:Kef-type K+ transport system membrane component KefB|uniref:cation:proton antiporter n=1 Tax=Algiphilus aromaticivorans TaxID=382454 RepID=UPI000693BFA7|nr:cation:proton antiporter [Algiphilus aromaticivorans]